MIRFILRRLVIIPVALVLVNFFGYTYARIVAPNYYARNPLYIGQIDTSPLIPAYGNYVRSLLSRDVSASPSIRPSDPMMADMGQAAIASLGLLGIALILSILVGLLLGLRAARSDPARVAAWLTALSTLGLAMPGF